MPRNTTHSIWKLKEAKKPIVCLTAYTHPTAKILDKHCDILLVGDSLGMVLYGMDSTLTVDLNMMIDHGRAVVKASAKALVVIDMPFGTYQVNKEQAFKNAAKAIRETGAQAVKIEGGEEMAETIKFLTNRGIAVMAHIGLLPQHFNQLGGYKVQGKDSAGKKKLLHDLQAVEKAGAFSVVLEATDKKTADAIVKKSKIPVIGIGASTECDGQVLVSDDILGLTENPPSFAKQYANISVEIENAAKKFAKDVRERKLG
jgi:3-methyl-2-oxobutanoate hydroxymethyltransferase